MTAQACGLVISLAGHGCPAGMSRLWLPGYAAACHFSCACPFLAMQCREQLRALSGLRSQLAVLQTSLTEQKRQQQQHKVQEACAEADRQQEVSLEEVPVAWCRASVVLLAACARHVDPPTCDADAACALNTLAPTGRQTACAACA